MVTDTNPDVLKNLAEKFPSIEPTNQVDESMSNADFLFISLHPPVVGEMLHNIVPFLGEKTTIVSLAPKIKIATINQLTGASRSVIRMIPNAASYVNEGYNPVVFGSSCPENIRKKFTELMVALGQMPEVPEEMLEAYTVITAMGPTYSGSSWLNSSTLHRRSVLLRKMLLMRSFPWLREREDHEEIRPDSRGGHGSCSGKTSC